MTIAVDLGRKATNKQTNPVNLLHVSCKHVFSIQVENSVESDHMALPLSPLSCSTSA